MCFSHLKPGERGSPERERDLEQEREPVPYSQHLHSHHHTHLGMGYTLMPGQYDPYPGIQQLTEETTVRSTVPPQYTDIAPGIYI